MKKRQYYKKTRMKVPFLERIRNRLEEVASGELEGIGKDFHMVYHTSGILRVIFWRRLIPQIASVLVIITSILVLVGWAFDMEILKTLIPFGATIKVNCAIGFAFLAIALLILQQEHRRPILRKIAQGLACAGAMIGLISIIEYTFGIQGGIDNLLIPELPGALGTSEPGRMAVQSAVALVLLGWGLMLLARERAFGAIHFGAIMTGFIGLVGFTGYVYKVPLFYTFANSTQMSLITTLILMLLSLGLLFARPNRGFATIITSDSAGGNMARHLLPAAVFIPLFLGLLRIMNQKTGWYDAGLELSLQGILSISLLTAVIWENAKKLHQIDYRRKTAEETMRHQALHDPLTGLPNRKAIRERFGPLKSEALKNGTSVAFIFIDLDRFKNINDTLGHYVGDEILKEVSARFSSVLRSDDMICRLGGDEFLVVAPGVHKIEEVKHIAEKVLNALSGSLVIQGQTLHVGTSMGIAMFPQDGTDIHTLLQHSDTALYRAKEGGRNRYQFYDYSMNVASYAKLSLENDLRSAVDRNELVLYYQPINDMHGRLIGIEVLLRWHHRKLGLLEPSEFIPLAEETGLILPIGEWVIRTAVKQHAIWIRNGFAHVKLAINFSSRQFSEFDIAEKIRQIQRETGFDPQTLELEITESIAMENTDHTASKIKDLRSMGITLSIDDFGTGYSSLSYLKRFPVHRLKIDRSFVAHCTSDEYDASIVRAIIAMAHSLGIDVIAEGVESTGQLTLLREAGADGVQGYLLGKPMPEDLFTTYLHEHTPQLSTHE